MKQTKTTDDRAKKARSIAALAKLLDDEWYDAIEGCYTHLPTWGPKTESVENQIGRSCDEGDIVSWDTRAANPAKHLYLRRTWHPAHQSFESENIFEVVSSADYDVA